MRKEMKRPQGPLPTHVSQERQGQLQPPPLATTVIHAPATPAPFIAFSAINRSHAMLGQRFRGPSIQHWYI